jgi:HPt (histidine-containing phosphotransfer) domain-containing protein
VKPTAHPIEIDFGLIEDLAEGDSAVLADLVATFIRHTANGIAKVRTAMAAGEFSEASRVTHTCIGFTATIGITALVPILRKLERAAKAGRREEMARCLAQWDLEFEQVRQTLEARIAESS